MNFATDNAHSDPESAGGSQLAGSVRSAMSAARRAQIRWAGTPLSERLARVRELRRLIAEHALRLAGASASERQRPVLESLTAEVLPVAEACRFLEREAAGILAPRRLGRRGRPLWLPGVRTEVRREPLGVVLIIGPGNYPLLLPAVQLVQCLVAGNAALLKPGAGGSPAARAFVELLHRAGFDSGLVALLPESADAARAAIEAQPDKVIFTGSAVTGEKILAQLAPRLIPATMELSGSDAVIVRADADLDLVVKSLRFGLTLNNGATCMAPKRAFVHRAIATELEGCLATAFGSGAPVSSAAATSHRAGAETDEPLQRLLVGAIAAGAHFVAGGVSAGRGLELPAILAGVAPSSRLLQEDVFAPVLSVVTVADDMEALELANASPYALGASVFSRDESAGRALAACLNGGVVTVNDLILPSADARVPFGGSRRSGFGVTRGPEGLRELTVPKVVTTTRSRFRPALEAPRPQDEAIFLAYLSLAHGHGFLHRLRALLSLGRALAGHPQTSTNKTP